MSGEIRLSTGNTPAAGEGGFAVLRVMVALTMLLLMAGIAPGSAGSEDLSCRDREALLGYARDTWKSVAAMGDCYALPGDRLRHHPDGRWEPTVLTTPADIACYLWSVLAAERLRIIDSQEALHRLAHTLKSLRSAIRAHGFFYDKLDARDGSALKRYSNGTPIPPLASSVDNGWLAVSLTMIRNTKPALREEADHLLSAMDFGFYYVAYDASDPKNHPGQIHGAYFIKKQAFTGFHQIINTEQRIVSYIGIARGQIPAEHYYRVERTLKLGELRQSQVPAGETRIYFGIPVFEGHYTYRGMRIVPSWGGSMFEALMVTLFVPEERWAPRSWGINHPLYVRAQIEHGLDEAGYGYWGFSPARNPDGGYRTYGVDALGSDPFGYTSNNAAIRAELTRTGPKVPFKNGIVTPHASFLALRFAPREALENLRKLRADFAVYGEYGFMDSVNVSTGQVSDTLLMLDQGMIMAAIANALAGDAMRSAFIDHKIEQVLRPLLAVEEFTAGPAEPVAHAQ
jgi:hypothetical protein